MKYWRYGLAVGGVGVVLVLAFAVSSEPTYQHQTVQEWVWRYAWTNQQGLFHEPPTAAMRQIGPRAVVLLVKELKRQNQDRDSHKRAYRLWFATPDWLHRLLDWREPADLGDAYKIRAAAAITLGSLGTQASSAIPVLQAALSDPTPHVRLQAAYALWQIDHSLAGEPVPILMELHTNQYNFQYDTCRYFGEIGQEAKAAIPLVRASLHDANPNIRESARGALRKLEHVDLRKNDANH